MRPLWGLTVWELLVGLGLGLMLSSVAALFVLYIFLK